MNFRTEIRPVKSDFKINHQSNLLMLGSCFTNNIGQQLVEDKFDVLLNPFGVLYNPISIQRSLDLLIDGRSFGNEDLFQDHGVFNSFFHHSSFSNPDKTLCLENINSSLEFAVKRLKAADTLIITFGTSYVYEYINTGEVVSNCHKLPASSFRRYRLTVEAIVNSWSTLIERLNKIIPNSNIIFTVSPIRHLRDGAHDNQLSKSTLLLSIEKLQRQYRNVSYFPAYEIVLDDLRDYRFFDADMTHPNSVAIQYISELFQQTYFSDETVRIVKEWQKIKKSLEHRPIINQSEINNEYIDFLKQTLLKLNDFSSKYPFICVTREKSLLEEKIK